MKPAEFEAIADLIGAGGAPREAARLVLIKGMGYSEAGRETRITRQQAYNAAQRILRADAPIRAAYQPRRRVRPP